MNAVDDPLIMSQTLEQMATVELGYDSPVLSARFYEGAYDAAKLGDEDRVFQIRQNMAAVYRRQGNNEKGAGAPRGEPGLLSEHRPEARTVAQSQRSRREADKALQGDLSRAEADYREALNLIEALGDQRFYVAALNLGIVYAETGRPVEARFQLEQCHQALKASRIPGLEGATYLCLAYVHAQLQSARTGDSALTPDDG